MDDYIRKNHRGSFKTTYNWINVNSKICDLIQNKDDEGTGDVNSPESPDTEVYEDYITRGEHVISDFEDVQ